MPSGGDWAVALVVLAIFLLLVGMLFAACRLCRVTPLSLTALRGGAAEEKTVLTGSKDFLPTHYLKQSSLSHAENGLGGKAEGEGTSVRHQYFNFAMPPEIQYTTSEDLPRPPVDFVAESPGSDSCISVSSDGDALKGDLRRASFESVSSDVSVEYDVTSFGAYIGQLEFALEYDSETNQLIVSVIQAKDLEKNDVTATIDSFIKLWLSPDTNNKRQQTKIQRATTNPQFKERFMFNISAEQLEERTLTFHAYSSDKYARIRLLGEAELRLGDVDIKQPIKMCLNFRNMDERPTEYGSILFSLSYLPTAERITIVVVKAREIVWPTTSNNPHGECSVKVYLIQNGKKIDRKRVTAKKEDRNVTFNEALIFSVSAAALQHVQLRVKLVDYCATSPPSPSLQPASSSSSPAAASAAVVEQLVGHVTVGGSSSGTELSHWNQMIMSPRKPVSMWHTLYRPSVHRS